jgi:two-component sensor histidine kinase
MSDPAMSVITDLLDTQDPAGALESDRFKQFLDQAPVAVAVSQLWPEERVVYANLKFEGLIGQTNSQTIGQGWELLPGQPVGDAMLSLGRAVVNGRDHIGAFLLSRSGDPVTVDAWSNLIEGDDGEPMFRLLALVETSGRDGSVLDDLQDKVREKDTQLRELQHRVKNNLQMITALIRIEARGVTDLSTGEGFDRLAGRVEALGLLYHALAGSRTDDAVDLGVYLSEIASAVMRAHAVEGIHLDLQVDTWPVSIDVAMPTGLVVNELLTNALKHAFRGRDGGTIRLHCTTEGQGFRVVIADDGVALPEGVTWPKPGKLSSLIVRSLLQNANARLDVRSEPGWGMEVTIRFNSKDATPQ